MRKRALGAEWRLGGAASGDQRTPEDGPFRRHGVPPQRSRRLHRTSPREEMGIKDTRALEKERLHRARHERLNALLDDQDREACGLSSSGVAALVRPGASPGEIRLVIEEVLRAVDLSGLASAFRICLANLAVLENRSDLLKALGVPTPPIGSSPEGVPGLTSSETTLKTVAAELLARMVDREEGGSDREEDEEEA